MLAANFTKSLDGVWSQIDPIRVGRIPVTFGTPDRFVCVEEEGEPGFRIDVYAYHPACFAFEEVLIWRDMIVIGFGSHVHAVSMADHSAVTIDLGSYFGHFYPTADYLLAASGERLFRFEPDRSIIWKSGDLAIDGVVVHDSGPTVIRGEGEWDPPGGWKAFAISVDDGSFLRQPIHS